MTSVEIPNRPVFRAQEVCELAEVQPYVLRTWEAEFPDLGVAKTTNGPRVYRRADVERVLRIKHLLFVDGLTLAGVRRRLGEEGAVPAGEAVSDADVAALMDGATRQQLRDVRNGLQWILGVLAGEDVDAGEFVLRAAEVKAPGKNGTKPAAKTAARGAERTAKPAAKGTKAGKKPAASKKR